MDAEKLFYEVENLLKYLSHRFIKRFGGDFDEVLSEANLGFVQAFQTFNPDKGAKFSTWVHLKVWRKLQEIYRSQKRLQNLEFTTNTEELWQGANLKRLDTQNWRICWDKIPERIKPLDLSEDANTIIRLVLQSPKEFFGSGKKPKKLLRRTLTTKFGWSPARIFQSFLEIQNAI